MDKQIEELIALYTKASQRIIEAIQKSEGATKRSQLELLKSIGVIVSSTEVASAAIIVGIIEKAYVAGSKEAADQLRVQGVKNIDATFSAAVHREAVQNILDEAFYNILEATEYMTQDVKDRLESIIQKTNQSSLVEGVTRQQATRKAIAEATETGITGIVTKNGAKVPVEKYLFGSIQYHQRKAHVDGSINRMVENGEDLMQVNSVGITCSICAQYQGRVYSISGKDSRFPAMTTRPPYHAHCVHSAYVWHEEYQSKEDINKMLKDSSRPFEDNRSEANMKRYNELQREKSKKNETRKQWIRHKARSPDLPDLKTFASHKARNTAKYQEWQDDYRSTGALFKSKELKK